MATSGKAGDAARNLADAGLSVSSIGRLLASITYAHKLGREENPCAGGDLREVLAGVRRALGTVPRRKAAATRRPRPRHARRM
jgi:hypothetical protein